MTNRRRRHSRWSPFRRDAGREYPLALRGSRFGLGIAAHSRPRHSHIMCAWPFAIAIDNLILDHVEN